MYLGCGVVVLSVNFISLLGLHNHLIVDVICLYRHALLNQFYQAKLFRLTCGRMGVVCSSGVRCVA